jgi:hypothetical protein
MWLTNILRNGGFTGCCREMTRYAKKRKEKIKMIKILFICHGNSAQTVPEALKIRHFSQWWIDFTTFLQL